MVDLSGIAAALEGQPVRDWWRFELVYQERRWMAGFTTYYNLRLEFEAVSVDPQKAIDEALKKWEAREEN